jgi:putative hemolysin
MQECPMSPLNSALSPFSLDSPGAGIGRRLLNTFCRPVERALGLSSLNQRYAAIDRATGNDFLAQALASIEVSYQVSQEDLARVPTSGPLVVVANHPFGGLDGLILLSMLRKVRPDARIMANYLLGRVPELREHMLFVDPFGGTGAARSNLGSMRAAIEHLKAGGALIIFPAGEVSHLNLRRRAIIDPPWSESVARLVRMSKAAALPVYFHGNNSKLFNLVGLIHPLLRTAMLPRELLNKQRTCIRVDVGSPIPSAKLDSLETDSEMTAYLRLRTHILQTRRADTPAAEAANINRDHARLKHSAIASAGDPGQILEEIQALPRETLLLESPEFSIHMATAAQIPHALQEIGRLREITFRGTHEGTGKPRDLDEFDLSYLHLFCWSKARHEIVGAYRIGQSDVILPQSGVAGLYTRTLFRFDRKLMEQLGPALELGRSFVRPEYQRSYSPLLMLWKGIGAFVVRNPRYQVLFGPVSINNQYQSISRQLIMTFLRTTSSSHLAGLIRANNPPRIGPLKGPHMDEYSTVVRDIDEVSDLVQEVESDRKGIPILLKQYMKLSARLLGFNVDPDFGDVLDGLILVDFRQITPKLVERFCGKQGATTILEYQKAQDSIHTGASRVAI